MTRTRAFKLAAAVLIAAAAAAALRPIARSLVAGRAAREFAAGASAGLRAPVVAGGVEVPSLSPIVIVYRDVAMQGRSGSLPITRAEADRLTLSGPLAAFFSWGRHPVEFLIEGPRIGIDLDAPRVPAGGGTPEAAGTRAALPPGSTVRGRGGRLELTGLGATLTCDPMSLDAGPGKESPVAGRLACGGGALVAPFARFDAVEGQAGFSWSPETLHLDLVLAHAPGVDLSGKASVALPGAASIDGEAGLDVDLAAIAAFLPEAMAPSGHATLRLAGRFTPWPGALTGTFEAAPLRLYGVDADTAAGRLGWDGRLQVDDLAVTLLGGTVRGSGIVTPGPDGLAAEATITAERLDAARLLAIAAWPGPPIAGAVRYEGKHAIGPAGLTTLSGGGRLALDGTVAIPGRAPQPLTVGVGLVAHGTTLTMKEGTVATATVTAAFDGRYAPSSGLALRLRGGSGALGDLLPLFTPARRAAGLLPAALRSLGGITSGAPPPARSPLEILSEALGGRWEWDGDLTMDAKGLRYAGAVRARGLQWHGAPIGDLDAVIKVAGARLTIDSLDLRLAPGGRAAIKGAIEFDRGGRLDLTGALDAVPVEMVGALLEKPLPMTGLITGAVEARGPFAAPEGRLDLQPAPFKIGGVSYEAVSGTIDLKDGVLGARPLEARLGDGTIHLEGGLRIRPGSGSTGLDVAGTGLDLTRLSPLVAMTELTGIVGGGGRLDGDLLAPSGRLALAVKSMAWRGLAGGDLTLDADLAPERSPGAPIRSSAHVRVTAPARSLAVEGTVGLGGDWPIDLGLQASDLTMRGAELVEGIPEEVYVWLGGQGTVAGPAAHPMELTGRLRLDTAGLAVGAASARTEKPVEAALANGRLEVQPAVLSGTGTRLELKGGLDLDPLGTLAVEADGRFDLALLRTFVRGLQAEGSGSIMLNVTGLRRDPVFRGSLTMKAPRLRYGDLPCPIDDLNAVIAFDGLVARIESLTFRGGGGEVTGSGEALIGKSGVSRGLAAILAADVTLKGSNVRAEFPAGFRSLSDPMLRLVYDPTGAELSGDIDFLRGVYERDFRIESSILRGQRVSIFDLGSGPPGPMADMRLDLALRAPEQIWLRNDFGRIEGQVDLRVGGTAAAPTVTGRITALEGSTIDFNRVRYRVLSGTIDFNDPEAIDPNFNLQAETTIAEYTVTLRVNGTLETLRYDLTSDPPLPTGDIVALLITGSPPSAIGSGLGAFSADKVSAYLAGQFTQEVTSRFLGRVAPDVIAIDPLSLVSTTDPSTRITLGKQVTPDLRVTYSDNLGGNAGSSYQVDYSVARNIALSSLRDSDGSIGGDVRFTVPGKPPILPGAPASGLETVKPRIAGLKVEGEPAFTEKRILDKLRLEPGKKRDRGRVNDRLEKLLALYRREGYLMAEADVIESPAGEGKVDLIVRAHAGPRVHLKFEGVRGKRDLRAAVEPIWRLSLFLEDTLENSRQVIEDLIRDDGWRRAAVTVATPPAPEGELAATFTVTRGPRAQADEVRIEGTRQVDAAELHDLLTTKTDGLFRRGIVRGEKLKNDGAALSAFLLAHGFPKAKVADPGVDLDATGRRAVVTFTVDEGPRVTIGTVRFAGTRALSEAILAEKAGIPPGGLFTRTAIDEAAGKVRRAYDDAGWPDVKVRWSAAPLVSDSESEQDEVTFKVEEGTGQTIASVELGGNAITDDTTILRALRLDPHTPLSRADLLAAQTRMYRLGIFRSVDLRPVAPPEEPPTSPASATGGATEPVATTPPEPLPPPEARPVVTQVLEASPIRQVYGIGYDSEEKVRGLYEIAHRNLFGTARYLGLQLRASDLEDAASIVYREQGVFGRYDLLGSAFGIDEERPAFTGRTVGVAAQLSRELGRYTRLQYRYALKDVNLSESTVDFTGQTLRLASLAGAGVHDTRDSPFSPTRGHYYALELQGYGDAIGSDAQFAKAFAQAYTFRAVASRSVWAQAIRAGIAPTFGRSKSDPASTGDAISGLPQSERFFAGGSTTLRGFGRDLVGPLDENGDPIGGEGMFLLNEELRFPVWRSLHAVVFAETGNVYRTVEDFSFRDLRLSAGAGLRLATPIGPFRAEYGWVLDRQEGEDPGTFYISIGEAF
ncbi:MAG TPA: translocation/assembly module TamB domain-containing protein [Dongiaceae bacterium]|nr:translocation/assembly module TamB domain-containing protein [Dongiaceae bacterium]